MSRSALLLVALATICKGSVISPLAGDGSCTQTGNTYRIIPNTACTAFSREADDTTISIHTCPSDFVFDVDSCVCVAREDGTKCVDTSSYERKPGGSAWTSNGNGNDNGNGNGGNGWHVGWKDQGGSEQIKQQAAISTTSKWNFWGRPATTQRTTGAAFISTGRPTVIPTTWKWNWPTSAASLGTAAGAATVSTSKPTGVTTTVTTKAGSGGYSCVTRGDLYEIVASTYCVTFLLTAASGEKTLKSCSDADRYAFDVDKCACNLADDFECPDGNLPRPAISTTSKWNFWPTPATSQRTTEAAFISTGRPTVSSTAWKWPHWHALSTTQRPTVAPAAASTTTSTTAGRPATAVTTTVAMATAATASSTSARTAGTTAAVTTKADRGGYKCFSNGNLYEIVASTYCVTILLTTASGQKTLKSCPEGYAFDVDRCICNRVEDFDCPHGNLPGRPAVTKSTAAAASKADTASTTLSWTKTPSKEAAITVSPAAVTASTTVNDWEGKCLNEKNVYGLVANSKCTKFTQLTPSGVHAIINCPPGLAFDPAVCVCRYPDEFVCPSGGHDEALLKAAAQAVAEKTKPADVTVSTVESAAMTTDPWTGKCNKYNDFGLVANTGCTKFTQRASGGALKIIDCPNGLAFDPTICVCRYPEDFTCPDGGRNEADVLGAAPASSPKAEAIPASTAEKTTVAEPKAAAVTAERPSDKDSAAPGTCVDSGNVYAVVKSTKCRLFTQRTADGTVRFHSCPKELSFDLALCVCNHENSFVCLDN